MLPLLLTFWTWIEAFSCYIYEGNTQYVDIVPVLAKADACTPKERERLKNRVLEEIAESNIKIHHLPNAESVEDEDFKDKTRLLKASIPFTVVGFKQLIEAKGRVRGHLYPWGIVEEAKQGLILCFQIAAEGSD